MELKELEKSLGYEFRDKALLTTALTHPSYKNEHPQVGKDNQRLEFLGDAVIEIIVCHTVFERFSDWDEGGLTLMKSRLVNTGSVAKWGHEKGLSHYLLMGKGERSTGGAGRQSNLADAFEAVMGAIFLDGGMDAARSVLMPLIEGHLQGINTIEDMKGPKTVLQERLLAVVKKTPTYKVLPRSDNERNHRVEVLLCGRVLATGTGKNKREAERKAARKAIKELETYTDEQLRDLCG